MGDDKASLKWRHVILQSLMVVLYVAAVLMVMDLLTDSDVLWAVGAGSLASSSFIVFGSPSSGAAMPHRIIGGYLIGAISGITLYLVAIQFHDYQTALVGSMHFHVAVLVAALATGVCLFLMSLLQLQHPPAAGMAMVLVIDFQDYGMMLAVLVSATVLAVIRQLLRHRLHDLV